MLIKLFVLQKNLASFKTNSQVTALLLPISSGANGLNIVEARHVILVEPILNPAAELQAIGRVHRIGQTRETTVHRFIVQETIEERMHQILRHHHEDHHTDQNTVTIGDLKKLFLHPEELELQRQLDRSSESEAESGHVDASSSTNPQNANNESSGSIQQGDGESSDGSGSSGVQINDREESDGDACDDFYVGGRTAEAVCDDGGESCNDSGVIEEGTQDESSGRDFGESNSCSMESENRCDSSSIHGEGMSEMSNVLNSSKKAWSGVLLSGNMPSSSGHHLSRRNGDSDQDHGGKRNCSTGDNTSEIIGQQNSGIDQVQRDVTIDGGENASTLNK